MTYPSSAVSVPSPYPLSASLVSFSLPIMQQLPIVFALWAITSVVLADLPTRVDDQDPTVAFHGSWQLYNNYTGPYDDTLTLSNTAGDHVSLTFTGRFPCKSAVQIMSTFCVGTQIAVYGARTLSSGEAYNASATFSIDGGSAGSWQRSEPPIAQFNVVMYTSPVLTDAPHTILITNEGSYLSIDYFEIASGSAGESKPTAAHHLSAGALVGIMIASSVLGGGVACLIFWWHQRRTRKRERRGMLNLPVFHPFMSANP